MSEKANTIFYSRERKVTLEYNGSKQDFILIAFSAKDKAEARREAWQIQAETVKRTPELEETLRRVYLVQQADALIEVVLETERELFLSEAASTLGEDDPEYDAKLADNAGMLAEARRDELKGFSKEELANKLVNSAMTRILTISRQEAGCYAMLARVLHDENRGRLFSSVDDMTEALPLEVLDKLSEAQAELISERGDERDFAKTTYFQKIDNYAKRYRTTLSAAMEEDEFLVETAYWARYYELAGELIQQAGDLQLADKPSREVIDNREAFRQWVDECHRAYLSKIEDL